MARLRACESHHIKPRCLCLGFICVFGFFFLCHGKARSCYSPPALVGQCSRTETLNQISMDVGNIKPAIATADATSKGSPRLMKTSS